MSDPNGKQQEGKEFKICNVLGGLDVTRLISTNARNFFSSAIADTELMREYLSEVTRFRDLTSARDFASLEEMSRSLDWAARGLPVGTTSTMAGFGFTDDRADRRVERFASTKNFPLVGDKESDFAMVDGISPLLPWLIDRRSKEQYWWKDHDVGRSEGDSKEPFMFDSLYTAAWVGSFGGSTIYYPPLSVHGHPLNLGQVVGGDFDTDGIIFHAPVYPENNPEKKATFTKPYPDEAIPGLALISAVAPFYYTGTFLGHSYNETYVAAAGIDIAIGSVSEFLGVLEDNLTPLSFGLIVDDEFNTVVISQSVVKMIYPERTGFEAERITYDINGGIVDDRRNQTYRPSDTILQSVTNLQNADWSSLREEVLSTDPGQRTFTTLDVTLTGEVGSIPFYVMYERWNYVADWTLLVFAPMQFVDKAIDIKVRTVAKDALVSPGETETTALEGERGSVFQVESDIHNSGNLDVVLSVKSSPEWVKMNSTVLRRILRAKNSITIPYTISTADLGLGMQSSTIVIGVEDDGYPDCSYDQDISIPLAVKVFAKPCGSGHVANELGECVCASQDVRVLGNCVGKGALSAIVFVIILVASLLVLYINSLRKRRREDFAWKVEKSDLGFDVPARVLGIGRHGVVLLAEYRGTQVAVKKCRQDQALAEDGNKRRSMLSEQARESKLGSSFQSLYSSGTFGEAFNKSDTGRQSVSGRRLNKSGIAKEIRVLSKIRHPNTVTIMGAVLEPNEEPMLVLEYMQNGSLYDMLQSKVELEGELVLSIIRDVVQGVQFLHNMKPQVLHGDLKSQNVLIDNRFRAKLSDFGLSQEKSNERTGTPYWIAPELLHKETYNTAASDAYSFGIVLCEIYSRKEPYEDEDVTAVLQDVCDPTKQKRPPLPSTMSNSIMAITNECLALDREKRPSFDEISTRVKRFEAEEFEFQGIPKPRKNGEKNFDILLKVFPRHIAEALRDGRPIEPENHECVTIFFSDIVSFTNISSELPPQKISDMLHRLFYRLDQLADIHNIFKVETIGDAYMAVSNCVQDQSEDHVKRIARFSLDAIKAANSTLVDLDDPDRGFVQLRVGFHSGPVLSNIVGTHNPHYTLFGDTVNVASRMESNSLPGKIHCSETSSKLLRKQLLLTDKIEVTSRGVIKVKGKGNISTCWISGDSGTICPGESASAVSTLHSERPCDDIESHLNSRLAQAMVGYNSSMLDI